MFLHKFILGGNLNLAGSERFTLSVNVTNYGNLHIEGTDSTNICRVRCINGGCFKN